MKKDRSASPPKYLIFFKARDADALTAAFTEYTGKKVKKAEENRAPLRAGEAGPVQGAAQKYRGGPQPPEGAGTMKQLNVKKLVLLNLPYFLLGCLPPTWGKPGGWRPGRTLLPRCSRSSPPCRWRWGAGGPACTHWICWWGFAAALACGWRCI